MTARKIAFVIDALELPAGGTERQLVHLIEGLDRSRFEPHVFCLRPTDWLAREMGAGASTALGLHVGKSPRLIFDLTKFARRLRRGRFDVVQTHFRDANFVGVLAATWAKTPVVISTRRGVPYWSGRLDHTLLRFTNRSVDHFVANSEATRDRYCRDEGIAAERFTVIHNGIEAERFEWRGAEAQRALKSQLGIPPVSPVVGIVANLRPVKGVRDFVEAAVQVGSRHPATHFVMVGRGTEEAPIRSRAQEAGLADRLHLLGARDDVPELLTAFDVGVLASHFESFSNSILEYLAADLPVVVTDVGGAREAVEDQVDGFVVPPRDPGRMAKAISALLDHDGGARAFRRARGLSTKFTLTGMVDGHQAVYDRLLAER